MRATNLEINFQKLVRDDNGSGYKSTCANEETVDETGLLRTRELAYKLSAKWAWAVGPGLGRIWPGLASTGRPGSSELGCTWYVAHWVACLVLRLGRALGCWPGATPFAGAAVGRRGK